MKRTGYWVAKATGESQDDSPDGYCEAGYDLIVIDVNGKPVSGSCDRIPGHPGDHWDKTTGLFWQGRPATVAEYDKGWGR